MKSFLDIRLFLDLAFLARALHSRRHEMTRDARVSARQRTPSFFLRNVNVVCIKNNYCEDQEPLLSYY